jgi:predicted site-specific integrase-resolvase
VAVVRTPGGKRLYSIADICGMFGDEAQQQSAQKAKVCYARVSSEHQQGDLERQIADLQ